MCLLGFEIISMSSILTDGLRWVNKGSAPNALMVNLRFTCSVIASTCNIERFVLSYANAVNVSASPVQNVVLHRVDMMTAGLRRG